MPDRSIRNRYLFAQLIPFFDAMVGLVGGLVAGPVSFFFPVVFFLGAMKLRQRTRNLSRGAGRYSGHGPKSKYKYKHKSEQSNTSDTTNRVEPQKQPSYTVYLSRSEYLSDSDDSDSDDDEGEGAFHRHSHSGRVGSVGTRSQKSTSDVAMSEAGASEPDFDST